MKTSDPFWKRNKKIFYPYLIALLLTLLTILFSLVTGHGAADLESRPSASVLWAAVSFLWILCFSALCIFLRVKRKDTWLKGLLLYQLVGLAAFVIHLLLLISEETTGLYGISSSVFYWWTLPYHEGALLAIRLFHFPVRYVLALMLAALTYIAARSLRGIKADKAFDQRILEKRELEAQAEQESAIHRVQSAAEAAEKQKGPRKPDAP